ncbi:LLM class F420-dependent oxidoreductase [Streptomyces sp. NPDC048664]|uniref:LLM class F420-dependent oxidoreductase n=1 Tax=Streptomyces sp. NPDC048664 TaxID=3154505 RepID=UPI00343E871B
MSEDTGAHHRNPWRRRLGRYGIWSVGLRSQDPALRGELGEATAELEELGYGAVWLGGSSAVTHAVPLVRATSRMVVATGIQSIWEHGAQETAARLGELEKDHPDRFLLGLGVSHAALTTAYARPYSAMVAYLDALDAAGVPAERRVLAALGPKMLKLSHDRAAGSHPYLVTPEHTAMAREILGEGPLLAPETKVILDENPDTARATARQGLARYLALPNYTTALARFGFTEEDFRDGGSDRLVDALFAWGDDDRVRERIDAYLSAGADHVALQVIDEGPRDTLPRTAWRRLAGLLR